ncbi:CASP-like protein 1C2 isoform X2 [Nicotiana sylvestris]
MVSAAIVMATSHEKITIFSVSFEANYSRTPAFKYFFVANIGGSVYSIVVLFLPRKTSLSRLILISDLVVTMVLTSSVSAALAVAHVGKKGNSHAGRLPICAQLHNFCNQVGGALIAAFVVMENSKCRSRPLVSTSSRLDRMLSGYTLFSYSCYTCSAFLLHKFMCG